LRDGERAIYPQKRGEKQFLISIIGFLILLKSLFLLFLSKKKIVAYLDDLREKIERLKQLQQKQLEELDELKKSILEKAFQGELVKS
jgi:type I restriction enzyme S subunit